MYRYRNLGTVTYSVPAILMSLFGGNQNCRSAVTGVAFTWNFVLLFSMARVWWITKY